MIELFTLRKERKKERNKEHSQCRKKEMPIMSGHKAQMI